MKYAHIDIDFENKGSGLMSKGILKDFEIAGDEFIYKRAKAVIRSLEPNSLQVT